MEFSERLQAAGFAQATVFQAAKRNALEIDHLVFEEIHRFDGALTAARERAERAPQAADQLVLPDIEPLGRAKNKVIKCA